MKGTLAGTIWRLSIFVAVCLFSVFAMFAVFGQLRFQNETFYIAEFSNVSGLSEGDFVRVAGVEVGKVDRIRVQPDSTLSVRFSAKPTVMLTGGSRAVIRYDNLVGGRYLALEEGAGGTSMLLPNAVIPLDRTSPALDLDALIGGFRPLFRALEPEQVNALAGQLIQALQGQGGSIQSFLSNTATLTSTLADRDKLIGGVIDNLNTVLGSVASQNDQFDKAVTSLSELVAGLEQRKHDITKSVASTDAAAGSIGDLLANARPPLLKVRAELDRAAGLVVADHEYMDNLLNTLPDAYRALGRQGMYGDFFSFYFCDVVLKVNGKGGQPVYIKMVGQASGRCAPK